MEIVVENATNIRQHGVHFGTDKKYSLWVGKDFVVKRVNYIFVMCFSKYFTSNLSQTYQLLERWANRNYTTNQTKWFRKTPSSSLFQPEVSKEWKTPTVKTNPVRMKAKIKVNDGFFETYD